MQGNNQLVSIIMVNYNGIIDLKESLPSLLKQTYKNIEVIIVDNASTDNSVEYLRKNYPSIKVIEAGQNLGFGAGNNAGILNSNGEYLIFTNYDAEFVDNWVECMVEAASSSAEIGLVAPKIVLYDDRLKVNTCGLYFQYTGHAFSRGANELASKYCDREELSCVSGCAFLIKRAVLDRTGVFDEEFHNFGRFFHSSLEDIDLAWRAQLAGYKIVFDPQAVMYHKYIQKPLTPIRYYYLECGRYYILLKNYTTPTLFILTPSLILSEIISWVFVALKGKVFFKEKVLSYKWLMKRWPYIKSQKNEIVRQVSDRSMIKRFGSRIEVRHFERRTFVEPAAVLVNGVFQILKFVTLSLLRFYKRNS